jgi:branched-chain amino acid transport system substrate-binding protein
MRRFSRREFLSGAIAVGAAGALATCAPTQAPTQPASQAKPLGVDTIKIGAMGALSGAHADYGRQINMGLELAKEEINASGGILGSMIETRMLDEELKADVGVRNARQLVQDWGAHFLVGVDSSGVAMAIGPILPELDRIFIFTHAATHRLTEELVYEKKIKQIFRISVPVYQDAIVAAYVFRDKLPQVRRFATIGADYEYGRAVWALFKEYMKRFRPEAEFVGEAWAPFLTTDFSSHIAAVMATNPDVIIATPWAGEAVTLLRQAVQLGVFDRIQAWWQAMGGSVDVLEGIKGEVQANAFKGKLWATARYIHNYPDTPENRAFVEKFQKRWSRLPNYSAETTYSAVYAIKAAVEKARSIETSKVIPALEGLTLKTPAGERYIRPEDHQAVYSVPAGRVVMDPKYPIPIIGADLVILKSEDYFRKPPFEPVKF